MRASATEEPESPHEGTDGAWPVLRPRYVEGAAIPKDNISPCLAAPFRARMPHRLAWLDDPHSDMASVKDWGSMSEDK